MARASFSLIALTACGVLLAGCASNTKRLVGLQGR
jgi:outer membrane murein-binding lipoprotein Lpp